MATFKAPNHRDESGRQFSCVWRRWCFAFGCGRPRTRPVRIVLLLFLLALYVRQQLELASGRLDRAGSNAAEDPSGSGGSQDRPFVPLRSPPAIRREGRGATSGTSVSGTDVSPIKSIRSAKDLDERQRRRNDPVKIVYVGEFGLGHRLSKMSAAYHLVWMMQREHNNSATSDADDEVLDNLVLEASWGRCEHENGTRVDIFASLFGPEPLLRSYPSTGRGAIRHNHELLPLARRGESVPKTILIRNDVKGYYAGQMYKNARAVVTPELVQAWDYKMHTTDLDLFRQLIVRFRFRAEAEQYQRERNWGGYFVVGAHFRLGNGEKDHFEASNRAVADANRLVQQTVQLILQYRKAVMSGSHDYANATSNEKPWAIYVASDTPAVMPMVQDALDRFLPHVNGGEELNTIPLWASPSLSHLPERGVSYTITQSSACSDGWKYAMLDQFLLSRVQMLVAPTRSTFTQIFPRAMVMSPYASRRNKVDSPTNGTTRVGGTFCEVEFDQLIPSCSARMSCHTDSMDWLNLRDGASRSVQVSIDDDTKFQCEGRKSARDKARSLFVPHKVLVHLPETARESKIAIDLWQKLLRGAASTSSIGSSSAIRYGDRIAQKYRSHAFHPDWNFS